MGHYDLRYGKLDPHPPNIYDKLYQRLGGSFSVLFCTFSLGLTISVRNSVIDWSKYRFSTNLPISSSEIWANSISWLLTVDLTSLEKPSSDAN